MKCPSEGLLRSFLDRELEPTASQEVTRHLEACPECRAKMERLESDAAQNAELLRVLRPAQEPAPNAELAYARIQRRIENGAARRPSWASAFAGRLWAGATAAVLIAILLSAPPARVWAQKILAMFRVQTVAVVPVDLPGPDAAGQTSAEKLLGQMISDSVVVTMNPGKPQAVADVATAGQMAGFAVRTPGSAPALQQVLVQGEGAFHMTLNRDRILDLLDETGHSDVQVPASVDGSTIAVHVPKMVRLEYGNCNPAKSAGCILLTEVPSPVISAPPSLDISALAQAGLQVAGMSAGEAQAFCKTVDWSSTLVIPVPQRGSSYSTVGVDGVNGTLIQMQQRGGAARYGLFWVKNGIVYSIAGSGSADQAVSMAESLN